MKLQIKKDSTNITLIVFIQDSSSTTGAGLTGLVYNSASLVCYYARPLAAAVALTLATQTVTGAHSDGGFVEIDSTNMPGVYRLDLSDAIVATGVDSVALMLKGATNMAPLPLEIALVAYDPQDTVRLGLTALPNAAADAAGGIPISDAGALDLDTKLANTNEVTAARMGALTDWINGGRLDLILDIIAADVVNIDGLAMRGTDNANTTTPPTVGAIRTEIETAAGKLDVLYSDWLNGGRLDLLLDAIKAVTDLLPDAGALTTIGTDTARLTAVRAAILTDWINGGRLDLLLDAIKAITDAIPNSGALTDIDTGINNLETRVPDTLSLANINAEVDSALDTALPASPTSGSINDILDRQEELIVAGTAQTGTLSTTEMTTDLTINVNDQYNGRILTFRKDTTTAALRGQQTDITDTVITNGKLTFTALTTAPVNGDVFDIT